MVPHQLIKTKFKINKMNSTFISKTGKRRIKTKIVKGKRSHWMKISKNLPMK